MKNIVKSTTILFTSVALLFGCTPKDSNRLTDGSWRAEFQVPENKIPFVFEVSGSAADSTTVVTLVNGSERVTLKGVSYTNDSVNIPIRTYDAVLTAKVDGKYLTGYLKKLYSGASIPFTAERCNVPRFPDNGEKPSVELSGTWEVTTEDSSRQVAIFEQKDGKLTGSILTSGGDYRYLEGAVQGERFYLSAFSGLNPYLVQGECSDNDSFTAVFVSPGGSKAMSGKRNPNAELPDAYSLTGMKDGLTSLSFTLPDLNGNQVSVNDPRFKDKVLIISILGSWCPNCLDEMAYLAPWYKENRERGVEIIGLAFERKDDLEYAKQQLSMLVKQYDAQYPILFAGKVGPETVAKVLPELQKISAYPTTIFIDKKGKVRKIHTGFSGPATGKFYEEFQKEFNGTVNELLGEK